eukprot:TRINITY_DN2431_c0_g1_i3.p1 TRINITY_DN2431_c0_g1~~TRINITY_DN2431_c0_g1_i3.p1  ORF type:complete len:216 (+),score=60.20 TRINITY_DN2431_c0_g1_i3:59-706(+)
MFTGEWLSVWSGGSEGTRILLVLQLCLVLSSVAWGLYRIYGTYTASSKDPLKVINYKGSFIEVTDEKNISSKGKKLSKKNGRVRKVAHGLGRAERRNGDVYIGEFKFGKFHGKGRYVFAEGRGEYEGEFEDDMFHGQGVERYANGSVYKGQFEKGLRHGKGVMTYMKDDGSLWGKYNGGWKEGKKHGYGKWTSDTVAKPQAIEFNEGKPVTTAQS